ncbi:MAG TPA: DUF3800 domain-containing protein [Brevundimonas sp.]|nr:DUF3800 domain-containing protein [Brevundimonas sp.]
MLPHPTQRYRLYIDETGIQSLKTAQTDRYLCLMGIIMRRDVHDGAVTDRLKQIKQDIFGHDEDTPIILHRRDIVRGEPPFDRLRKSEALAQEFQARWLALVREAKYLAMAAAIDKREHLERYRVWQHDPYHYCLECLLERYVKWLNRHGFVGDVLIEARGKGPDKKLKNAYRHFYRFGKGNLSPTVVQGRLSSGEPKFASKSDDVAALQIADSLAHPTLAYMRAKANGAASPTTYGQLLVDLLIQHKFARHPKTHVIEGWGMKLLP